jgi:uncharacterized protein (TIGR00369 family)
MSDAPIWLEPPRGAPADAAALVFLPGIEQLRSFLDGRSPEPPVARLTGRRLVDVGEGRAVYQLPVSEWLVGPKGTLHPGVIGFLADAPLLAAIQTKLGPAMVCTTAEVSTTFLGTASRGDVLTAEGRTIHVDGSTGLAEAHIRRDDGTLIGHATSRVFIFPPMPLSGEAPPITPHAEPAYATPDPYLRPVEGGTLPAGALRELDGLTLLSRQLAGELPRPPIDNLTGMRLIEAGDGHTKFALCATGWCKNELGGLFGGMLALLASSAGAAAVQTIAPAGTRFTALDMKLNILRAASPDGSEITATGTVTHRGRQLAIASADLQDARGRRVAIATGTTALERPQ